jgi:hypothetical protein
MLELEAERYYGESIRLENWPFEGVFGHLVYALLVFLDADGPSWVRAWSSRRRVRFEARLAAPSLQRLATL